MEATPPTPDGEPPEDQPDTPPPAEPVAAAPEAAPPDQPAAEPDRALGQAEYTRSQQAFSALKAELGLDRGATRDDVLAAVQALRTGGDEDDEGDEEPDDPRLVEANQRAFLAELRVSAAVYGQDFTTDTMELINFARTTDDPNELITAFAAYRDRHGAPAPAPDEPAAPEANPNAPPAPVGLSEGDAGPSARQAISVSAGRRESGVQQAVRGLFEAAGIASRPSKP